MSLGPAYETKEQVRQAIDIVDLIGGYIPLRRQGRGFVGLCPWHDDTRPSLQVSPDRQTWKCWVCNLGGDVFSFVERREGVGFREALEMLADRAGIPLIPAHRAASQPGSPHDKRTLYQAAAWAEKQFHECLLRLPEAEPARRYLDERGITPVSIERFRLGYSPDSWHWLTDRAKSTPHSPQVLQAVGLTGVHETSGRHYDRFKGRVIFPIRDTQRRPIAFGGRILPLLARREEADRGRAAAKYINSPETRLFSKSEQLYGLDLAVDTVNKERHIVVMEGYTDVVMARQCGLHNAVAVLGTALGERHVRLLRRFADTVTLVLDGDEAGQRRTNEVLELFVAADLDLRILTLPDGLDPFDFLVERGADAFRELLHGAPDALEHRIRAELRGINLATDTHRASQGLERILSTLAKAPRLSATTAGRRLREQQILARLAREFRVDEVQLRARMNELRRKEKPWRPQPSLAAVEVGMSVHSLDAREAELLEILLAYPELAQIAVEEIPADRLSPGPLRTIFETCGRFCRAGATVQLTSLLTELEDARLKSLVVQLDQQARDKSQHAQEEAPTRLRDLIDAFWQRAAQNQRSETLAALEKKAVDDEEELTLLEQLIEQERNRQGISAPTDG